jgi:O-antigen ligase
MATRAIWLPGALCLTLPLLSLWLPPDVPAVLKVLVGALMVTSAVRPHAGLLVLAGLGPIAVPLMFSAGTPPFGGNAFLEAMVLSALAGIAWRWCAAGPLTGGRLGLPSLAFGAVALSSVVTAAGLQRLVAEPLAAVVGPWWTHISRNYFTEPRAYPPLHEATVWLEALLLAVIIERVIRKTPRFGPALALVAACGLAAESLFSLRRLGEIVARNEDVIRALWQHALFTRISPHFPDVNAVGSLFALGTTCWLTVALGKPLTRWQRAGALGGTVITGAALWMTGSRAAIGATMLVGIVMWWWLRRPSLPTMTAVFAIGVTGLSLATAGLMGTPRATVGRALEIRVELAAAGVRMAADHPWLGVGLRGFSRHSREYMSPELYEQFPSAVYGENAHNQLIQILAEVGIIGLAVFLWYWYRVFVPAVRRTRAGACGPWLAAWTSGLCAFHLSALLGHPFLTPWVMLCVFVSVGVVAGLTAAES